MKSGLRTTQRLLGLALFMALAGCTSQDPTACDGSYYWLVFKVHDQADGPVSGVSIRDSIPRTHEVLIPSTNPSLPAGSYVGFEDGFISHIRETGDSVFILGEKGQSQFGMVWIVDAPGGCHIRKTFGANSILLP